MRPFSVRVYMYSAFQPFLRRCEQNDRTSSAFLKTSGQAKHDPNFPTPLFTIRYTGSSTGESIVRIARIKICRSLPEAEKEGNGESGRAFRRTNLRVSPVRDGARAFERFEVRLVQANRSDPSAPQDRFQIRTRIIGRLRLPRQLVAFRIFQAAHCGIHCLIRGRNDKGGRAYIFRNICRAVCVFRQKTLTKPLYPLTSDRDRRRQDERGPPEPSDQFKPQHRLARSRRRYDMYFFVLQIFIRMRKHLALVRAEVPVKTDVCECVSADIVIHLMSIVPRAGRKCNRCPKKDPRKARTYFLPPVSRSISTPRGRRGFLAYKNPAPFAKGAGNKRFSLRFSLPFFREVSDRCPFRRS